MKTELTFFRKTQRLIATCTLLLSIIVFNSNSISQSLPECTAEVPLLVIDLSSDPDSVYVSPSIQRIGQCCGGLENVNFISFYATLHPNAAMVEIGIADGANPSGSSEYHFVDGGDLITPGICTTPIPGGTDGVCIPDGIVGPDYKIMFSKPGNNTNQFFFRQILRPTYPEDDSTRVGCSLPLNIYGLDNIVISALNSSDGNIDLGLYESYLNCLNCSDPSFAPAAGAPDWIDYIITGDPQATGACGTYITADTVRLYTFSELSATYAPNPAEICQGGDVLITASATGGNGDYSFEWTNSNQDVISSIDNHSFSTEGSFTVSIGDALNSPTCPSFNLPVSVTLSELPTVLAGDDQIICASSPEIFLQGESTNTSSVQWSGGNGIFSPDENSLLASYLPTASEISDGSITLTLSSTGAGATCTDVSNDIIITFSDSVFAIPTFSEISCNGETSTLSAGVIGGTPGFTYNWSTGETSESIVVPAGTYSVSVADIYGCPASTTVSVFQPEPLTATLSSTNTSTDIACDGTTSVIISGGTAPYSAVWSNSDVGLTASNLCYGIATVVITDANGCVFNGSVVVNNPTCSAFSVFATGTNVSCYDDSDAQAFSFPSGGNAPYIYSWNTLPIQATQDASNLSAGTYTVTVTDNLGCIDVASVTVLQPSIITNTMTHMDASSIGGTEGYATANPMGGTPGYTYTWVPSSQNTQTAINLSTNTYYVNILDANSCLKQDSVFISEPPCNNFVLGVNATHVSCNGVSDGSAYVVISQGTAPFSIVWSSGELNVSSVSGLAAGSYTVTVTDASNCTTFETFDVTEPDQLTVGLAPTDISCFGADDGTIDLTVAGGVFPYSYEWTLGTTIIAKTEDLVNLSSGSYSIEVIDANGCIIQGGNGIAEPDQLLGMLTVSDIVCNGDDNGSIDVETTGGILPYSYSWTGPNGFSSGSEDLVSLSNGLYELQVMDGNNCMFSTVLQSYINEPDSVIIQDYSIDCPIAGENEAIVSIDSISGGANGEYQVSFDNGSSFGNFGEYNASLVIDQSYVIVAIDSNGCSSPNALNITIDPNVEITSVNFDPCVAENQSNVSITVSAIGGDSDPFEISTDGGLSFNSPGTYVISLPSGESYDIVAKDSNGCLSVPFPIVIPSPFVSSTSMLTEASCPGASDGSASLSISGGTSPFVISWTGPSGFVSANQNLSALVDGLYNVSISDDSNCVILDSVRITTTIDIIDPIITSCVADQSEEVDLDACTYTNNGTALDPSGTDDCFLASLSYVLTGATSGSGVSLDGVAFSLGETTVTWTATDGSGNTTLCIYNVTVEDNQLPIISSCGPGTNQGVITDLGECTYTHQSDSWDAIATDNCTISTISYELTGVTTGSGLSLNGIVFNSGITTVTWTVIDGEANQSECSFTVQVLDMEDPMILSCGGSGDESVNSDLGTCTFTQNSNAWDATASDNCSVATITYSLSGATEGSGTSLSGVIFNLDTTLVIWTVSDEQGNISTCQFNVIVNDNQLPSIVSCGPGSDQNVNTDFGSCSFTQTGEAWDAIVSDNCSIASLSYELSGVTVGSGISLDGVSFNLGTTTVTWTVLDGSQNSADCSFDVIVIDVQLPEISACGPSGNQTVNADLGECSFVYSGTAWNASVSDNCTVSSLTYELSGVTIGTGTDLSGVTFNLGLTTVTWTVSDNSGNSSDCSFTVLVEDDQLPAILSCGAQGNQSVSADNGECTYTHQGFSWDASANDNCTISTLTYLLSGASVGSGTSLDGVTFAQGTTTVIWTATDNSDNSITCQFNVIVSDNEVPVISDCVADFSVSNDISECGSIVSWTPPTFTDNCGAVMTSSHNPGDFFPVGTTTVTYTVIDETSNVSTCIFDITVNDDELPIMICQANIESCDSVVSFNAPSASDNCGIAQISQVSGPASGSTFPVGNTVITFEVIDIHGNISTCSFQVIIHPTPILETSTEDVSCNSFGDGSIDLTISNGSEPYDVIWSNNEITEDVDNLTPGTYGVTVIDLYGCSESATATITEPDQMFVSQELTQVSCFEGNNGAIDISVVGGVEPYEYNWSNQQVSQDVNGLSAGSYSVTISDANGCEIIGEFNIVEPNDLIIVGSVSSATCDAPNGSIEVLITGGVTPYAYDWSDGSNELNLTNVEGGDYSLTVTDANGCIAEFSDSVTAISNIHAYLHLIDPKCFGEDNGSALAIVDSGNEPFIYEWSNGGSQSSLNEGLSIGEYSVTITDFFGCETELSFQILQPDLLSVTLTSPLNDAGYNVSLNGAEDAYIESNVEGGIIPYTYSWSTGATDDDLFGVGVGQYQVTVMDRNGCIAQAIIGITQPRILEMPEGVSPNGDGNNDYFFVRGLDAYPDNDITIFNRWGNIVYKQNAYNNDWDGRNNKSVQLPDGTYFVILNANPNITLTGYIDLRRK